MKWLVTLLLILTTAITFTLLALEDPGFVIIGRGHWTIETTLSFFVILVTLGSLLLYGLLRFLVTLWQLPAHFLRQRTTQQQHQHQEIFLQSLFTLLESRWAEAEAKLLKVVSTASPPLATLCYFGATYAAFRQQAPDRAQGYLNEIRFHFPQEELSITLLQAQLQRAEHNLPASLTQALYLRTLAPKHNAVLLLLLTLYLQLADWPALLELLPELRKRKLLTVVQIQQLENRASIALIHHTLRTNPVQAATLWSQIPKTTRLRPVVLKVYVKHLITAGDVITAEPLLRESLKYHWDADLVTLYGELETPNTSQQINSAESWLKTHETDPVLLLTLGRLCLRHRLWGKAQQYLETSAHLQPQPLAYQLLGNLLTQQEDPLKAADYYRRGLQLALEKF